MKFPIEIDENGRPVISRGAEIIPQAIDMILRTPKGSRYFLPEYGSNLHHLVFEPNDEILKNLLFSTITECLDTWEKRIKVIDIEFTSVSDQKPKVECNITYEILKSNEVDSFIYPFYREIIF